MTILMSISGAGQAWLRSRRSRYQLRSLSPAPSNVPTSAFIATCKSAEDWQSLGFSSGCTSLCWHALWIRASYFVCWRYGNDNLKTTIVRFPLCKDLCNNWAFFALFSCKAPCCSVPDVFFNLFFCFFFPFFFRGNPRIFTSILSHPTPTSSSVVTRWSTYSYTDDISSCATPRVFWSTHLER